MPSEPLHKNHTSKILVVDDDESMRDTVEAILKGTYQVLKAESGEKALEILERNDIPLVLLDIKLPGMSGVEVLRQIKALYPRVEVIMISVLTDIDTVRECLSLGAVDYFTKEFDYDLLLPSVL